MRERGEKKDFGSRMGRCRHLPLFSPQPNNSEFNFLIRNKERRRSGRDFSACHRGISEEILHIIGILRENTKLDLS